MKKPTRRRRAAKRRAASGRRKKTSSTRPTNGAANLSHVPFLEAVKAAIIITDSEGTITYWNPFAHELYGWSSKEVVGRNIREITVSAETKSEAEAHMADLNAGKAWSGEFEVRCKCGRTLTALVTLSPMTDDRGTTVGIVGVSQDLSERKQVEEDLRLVREELENRVLERTAELNKATDSLRDLSARLLHMRDHEARRLARELHDSVGQLLAAIAMNLATVQPQVHKLDEAAAKAVSENAVLVEQISSEIRTISHLLHPPLLDELGLGSALQWYVEGFAERSKVEIQLEVPSDLGRLSIEMETAIFRIVQECLTNIHRHSGSKTAVIRILEDAEFLQVLIQDSGKGFPAEKLRLNSEGRSGVGFRGMAERIRHLGGELKVHSDAEGTLVTATLPVARATAAGTNN